jgi:hypothetical protein
MNISTVVSAANAVVAATHAQTEMWGTKLSDCCTETAKKEHWLYAIFCTPCAAAHSKMKADKSNPVFNFFCFMPVGSYSMVRHHYGIMGKPCDDVLYGWFCMPCAVRQMWTEVQIRGELPGRYGDNTGTWSAELTQCDCQEFWMAAGCPCLVAHDIRQLMHPKTDKCFDALCMLPCSMYGQVRHTYGINSEWPHPTCEDIFLGCFFYPCALNRALREAGFQKTRAATAHVANIAQQKVQAVQQAGANALNKIGQFGKGVKDKANDAMK